MSPKTAVITTDVEPLLRQVCLRSFALEPLALTHHEEQERYWYKAVSRVLAATVVRPRGLNGYHKLVIINSAFGEMNERFPDFYMDYTIHNVGGGTLQTFDLDSKYPISHLVAIGWKGHHPITSRIEEKVYEGKVPFNLIPHLSMLIGYLTKHRCSDADEEIWDAVLMRIYGAIKATRGDLSTLGINV